jgi:FtsP/CotA-like multicopper oxidase with cupredoxin domain
MRMRRHWLSVAAAIVFPQAYAFAQNAAPEICPRPIAGNMVSEPDDLRSQNGVLKVDFTFRSSTDRQGRTRYCYIKEGGSQSPNLRLNPGDVLILNLKNGVTAPSQSSHHPESPMKTNVGNFCAGGPMSAMPTNLHFHGLAIPPVCHQDEVLKTAIGPADPPFEYRFRVPRDEPPGLYWYHPHLHGFSKAQVLGGASGALIVEGIERANRQLAGLPERVFIIRDQELLNPDAEPVKSDSMPSPMVLRDAEGDILNTGTDGGKPAKDLSLNFVPVLYPEYQPAVIAMKPSERQLWRVLNASAITYLDLQVLFNNSPQLLGVVALDGVPIDENGVGGHSVLWKSHIPLPPAGRTEFIMNGPPAGVHASLVTRRVDTGPAGENDPTRSLATIAAATDAPEPRSNLPAAPAPFSLPSRLPLRNATPVRVRKLYLSEKPQDPRDPNSPTAFYITKDGQEPMPYDPNSAAPDIIVRQGDVEDWIIENHSQELHAFHIHQIHFMLMDWNGVPVDEPFLRDTVNVAYWDGKSPSYPSVKLRMDFRDPNIVGTFVYHCHLLEHEDGGMMGTIRVDPSLPKQYVRGFSWPGFVGCTPTVCGKSIFGRHSDPALRERNPSSCCPNK